MNYIGNKTPLNIFFPSENPVGLKRKKRIFMHFTGRKFGLSFHMTTALSKKKKKRIKSLFYGKHVYQGEYICQFINHNYIS